MPFRIADGVAAAPSQFTRTRSITNGINCGTKVSDIRNSQEAFDRLAALGILDLGASSAFRLRQGVSSVRLSKVAVQSQDFQHFSQLVVYEFNSKSIEEERVYCAIVGFSLKIP